MKTARLRPVPAPIDHPLSIGEVMALARRCVERALVLEELAQHAATVFVGKNGGEPRLQLQRDGEGPRPVDIETLVDVSTELTALAAKYKGEAEALYNTPASKVRPATAGEYNPELKDNVVHRTAKPAPTTDAAPLSPLAAVQEGQVRAGRG